jgi:hypothetical protein
MSNGLAKRLSRLEQRPTRACNCGKDSRVLHLLKEIRARLAKLETQKPRSVLSRASSGSGTGEVQPIGLADRIRQIYGLPPRDATGRGSAARATEQRTAPLSVPGSLDQRSEPAPVVMKSPG